MKDAKVVQGLFPVWQKDDKAWIEIPADMLDKPFFLSINMSRGIGERMLFAGLMGSRDWYGTGGEYVGRVPQGRRQYPAAGTQHDLRRARRLAGRAGGAQVVLRQPAVSAPVASAPHPERKSVLIEANALLLPTFRARRS